MPNDLYAITRSVTEDCSALQQGHFLALCGGLLKSPKYSNLSYELLYHCDDPLALHVAVFIGQFLTLH